MKKNSYLLFDYISVYLFIYFASNYFDKKTPLTFILMLGLLPFVFYISKIVRRINERIPSKILISKKYKRDFWGNMILFVLFASFFIIYSRTMDFFKIFCAVIMSLCWLWWCAAVYKTLVAWQVENSKKKDEFKNEQDRE